MKQIRLKFKSNGVTISKVACIKDDLSELSCSRRHKDDMIFDYHEWGFWSILFGVSGSVGYEVEFVFKDNVRTLTPIKVCTWENDIIVDEEPVDDLTIR